MKKFAVALGVAVLVSGCASTQPANPGPLFNAPVTPTLPTPTISVGEIPNYLPEPTTVATVKPKVVVTSKAPVKAAVPTKAAPPAPTYYANCAAVRAAGKAPIRAGQPGYSRKLDADGDGVGCEK